MATIEAPVRPELRMASDAQIEDAVGHADLMVLRGLLYQLTGDPELKAMELKRVKMGRAEVVAPATDADAALVRRKAVDFLKAYRDSGAGRIGYGPEERLPESLALIVGHEIKAEAIDLMVEETALDPWARSLQWQAEPDPARLETFSVMIIGAGMGGLNAAVQLKRAGIHYHIVEKNSGVGGTWYENRYPGARVDTPSRSYMNLFGVDFPYPYAFGNHVENQKYYDWVADEFDLRGDITFDTEVRALTWDEAASMWEIHVDGPQGEHTLLANAVITGVGFLNRPNMPEIEGMRDFEGPSWHTARWPEDVDLAGKRIAVIGTGCTGYQLVPELAHTAGHVTVFQRTPQWLFPVPGYLSESSPQVQWLDRNLPYHTNFMRFRAFYAAGPDLAKIFDIDPDFDDPFACSAVNKAARDASIAFLESKLSDPKLVEIMTPNHPAWSARPVVVDPEYSILDALQADNVTLVTNGIRRINRTGIEDGQGVQHDVDVIVYATGFRANDFLYPMTITGRGGQTIEALWAADGARAYLGCMMPGFPNLWALYGPNTNGGLPVAQFHEMTTIYALQCMEKLILDGKDTIEVKEDAYWRYNKLVDEGNRMKVWADPRAHNYWWTKHGRTASQIPFTGYEVREFLLHPDFADMEIH
ncbi:flavin-containing monooxygenase [Sphingomonas sp. MMS24-J13]|uniref:flavin-containing monooxygenase n=1 Tax=Sphingomonas sp. MMS24-J13 TaxID=3238686 RepID=UPI00384F8EC4